MRGGTSRMLLVAYNRRLYGNCCGARGIGGGTNILYHARQKLSAEIICVLLCKWRVILPNSILFIKMAPGGMLASWRSIIVLKPLQNSTGIRAIRLISFSASTFYLL